MRGCRVAILRKKAPLIALLPGLPIAVFLTANWWGRWLGSR